ncbi:hypothetical protein FGADI_2622 [Fusarium gaditjirri]|uniref:Ubiquitin-like protease family profile domain-containing protein n=1 Tax=Fusarium gaditjirri TaxID=282569 RepID=A0A8H4THM4_9HYPO|nr:hypothetical protein FGADI_2622 [Fusarium gaditjirri]
MAPGTPRALSAPLFNASINTEHPNGDNLRKTHVSIRLSQNSRVKPLTQFLKVKRYIGRVVDDSPDATKGITTKHIVARNLQQLPSAERRQVLDGLVKEVPKIKGIQQQAREHQANLRRAGRRDEQMAYLDKTWGGRQNWANPTFMPRITETISMSTTAPLTTITRLAVEHRINLSDLWQPGGELHDAAFMYGEHVLTKDKAAAALRAFKLRIENLESPDLDARDDADNEPNLESEEDRAAKRLKFTAVERSPSVELGRRVCASSLDHVDGSFLHEHEIHHLDDDFYVALPDEASSPPRQSVSPIHRHQSRASSIIHDDASVNNLETNQSTSQRAQQQLEDPAAQLTDDVLNLLLQHITRTSRTPGAKVLDPLYIQVDNNQESQHPPVGFARVCKSNEVIYIPLHHQSQGDHWSLAVLRPEQACVEHYDSLHSRQRESRIQACFESMLGVESLRFSPMACPQQQDTVNCGVFVVCFLGFLLNNLRFPTSLDSSRTRQKLLDMVLDPQHEPGTSPLGDVNFRKGQHQPATSTTHIPVKDFGVQVPATASASTPSGDLSAIKRTRPQTVRAIPQVRERIAQLENEINAILTRLDPLIQRKAIFSMVPTALVEMEEALSKAQRFGTLGSFWQSEEEATRANNLLTAYRAVENLAGCDPQSSADEIAALQQQLATARAELREARGIFRELANASLATSLLLVQESRKGE